MPICTLRTFGEACPKIWPLDVVFELFFLPPAMAGVNTLEAAAEEALER